MRWRGLAVRIIGTLALIGTGTGCVLWRDPLDPLSALDHRTVSAFGEVQTMAQSRRAYDRARERVRMVRRNMSVAQVEVAMEAVVVTERRDPEADERDLPREKVIEGLLCTVDSSPLRRRWLFGYDEGGVELVGFGVEFERDDPGDDDWWVHHVDWEPQDDCPEGGE